VLNADGREVHAAGIIRARATAKGVTGGRAVRAPHLIAAATSLSSASVGVCAGPSSSRTMGPTIRRPCGVGSKVFGESYSDVMLRLAKGAGAYTRASALLRIATTLRRLHAGTSIAIRLATSSPRFAPRRFLPRRGACPFDIPSPKRLLDADGKGCPAGTPQWLQSANAMATKPFHPRSATDIRLRAERRAGQVLGEWRTGANVITGAAGLRADTLRAEPTLCSPIDGSH
jgi:hypothetical protein